MRHHQSPESSSSSSSSKGLRHRVADALDLCGSALSEISAALPAIGAKLKSGEDIGDEGALKIATAAYLYGYPLVTMEMTRRVLTNVASAADLAAPMGQFTRTREYPKADFKAVTAPNADTLYTTAWLDLSNEPYVLNVPDMKGRYYLLPMLDAWTEVFQVPGKRTTGTSPQKYLITGPGWKGDVPADVVQYKCPTSLVWILGRIYSSGTPEDYAEVHALQDQITLVPLSAYGKPYTPPPGQIDPSVDMKTAVRDQVNKMEAREYFGLLAELMVKNPPTGGDVPMVLKMAQIGIVPGKALDEHKFSRVIARWSALGKIKSEAKHGIKSENGWEISLKTGRYETDYLNRAFVTAIGLGANRPEDAVYPVSKEGADGHAYNGSHRYVLHVAKGELPPVRAFWSLTMYNPEMFFVDNPLNRYTLSARNDFEKNADGSVDLYIQKDNPGGSKEANWLPAPAGKFVLMLRLYWPNDEGPTILDGTWKPPALTRAD